MDSNSFCLRNMISQPKDKQTKKSLAKMVAIKCHRVAAWQTMNLIVYQLAMKMIQMVGSTRDGQPMQIPPSKKRFSIGNCSSTPLNRCASLEGCPKALITPIVVIPVAIRASPMNYQLILNPCQLTHRQGYEGHFLHSQLGFQLISIPHCGIPLILIVVNCMNAWNFHAVQCECCSLSLRVTLYRSQNPWFAL